MVHFRAISSEFGIGGFEPPQPNFYRLIQWVSGFFVVWLKSQESDQWLELRLAIVPVGG